MTQESTILTGKSDVRWFPVIVDRMREPRNNKIPWTLAEIVYEGYSRRYGTNQSLERIAERGGFGVLEIADHLGATIESDRATIGALLAALENVIPDLEHSVLVGPNRFNKQRLAQAAKAIKEARP